MQGDDLYVQENEEMIVDDVFGGGYQFGGKGVIYFMKDEYNNEAPYDFKNIMFTRNNEAVYTFDALIDEHLDGSMNDLENCAVIENKLANVYQDNKLALNNTVFLNTPEAAEFNCSYNTAEMNSANNTVYNNGISLKNITIKAGVKNKNISPNTDVEYNQTYKNSADIVVDLD